jgi:hypothetical protein
MKALATTLILLLIAPALCAADALLIRGATVHTMSDTGVLGSADILLVGDRIEAVGSALAAPDGARVIEARGRPVTPTLFAGITAIGIGEVPAVTESSDSAIAGLGGPPMRPEFDVSRAYNPHSSLVPVARIEGFGFTLLGARIGDSIVAGQGRIARLDGGYDSLGRTPVLFIGLGRETSALSGGSRAAQWMLLDQLMSEAETPPRLGDRALTTRAGRGVMKRFSRGGTVVFHVDRAADILQAVAFAASHGMRAIIAGGAEAWMVAPQLAAAQVPVLLNPLLNLPGSFDALGARLDNAALLHAAGVTISFTGAESHNARKQRQMAGNAVANGLDHGAALVALTRTPAELFGVDGGLLEAGQPADLVLWSGDPLEVTTTADLVILGGEPDPMVSRQTLLRDRYLPAGVERPRAYVHPAAQP